MPGRHPPGVTLRRSKDTKKEIGFTMQTAILAGFSLTSWFFEAWGDLTRYFNTMNTIQWGVLAACAVIFGFLCLKGSGINHC
jgi:hypothetical protein